MFLSRFILFVYRLVLFFSVCWGAMAWFTWGLDSSPIYAMYAECVFGVISILYWNTNKMSFIFGRYTKFALFLFIILIAIYRNFDIIDIVRYLLRYSPILLALFDYTNVKGHMRFISISLCIILVPGLILHFIMLNTGIFPSIIIQRGDWESYYFFNYIFLLKGAVTYESEGLRFQSVFLEPGYCATLLSFILYSNEYEFRKFYNKVILLGVIASMSLAGYLTTLVGFILNRFSQHYSVKKYVPIFILLLASYSVAVNYNDGHNVVNELIIERLQPDEDKGIAGNNRVSERTEDYFHDILKDGRFLFGVGQKEVDRLNGGRFKGEDFQNSIAGAGYQMYLIVNGLVSALLWLLFYYLLAKNCNNKRYSMGFVIVVFITFLQCAYPYSMSWLIPYILAIVSHTSNKNNIFSGYNNHRTTNAIMRAGNDGDINV